MGKVTAEDRFYLARLKEEIIKKKKPTNGLSLSMEYDLHDLEDWTGVSFGTLKRIFGFDNSKPAHFPNIPTRNKLINWLLEENVGWEAFIAWYILQVPEKRINKEVQLLEERAFQGFPIAVDKTKVSLFRGEIQVEIEVFPKSGYRSAMLIYRGEGGVFRRPIATGDWQATDMNNQGKLKCHVPKGILDTTTRVSVTCQLIGLIDNLDEKPIGKVIYTFKIEDLNLNTDTDYLTMFLIDAAQEDHSAPIFIEAWQLK